VGVPPYWPHDTLLSTKVGTEIGRSVGIICLRTKGHSFFSPPVAVTVMGILFMQRIVLHSSECVVMEIFKYVVVSCFRLIRQLCLRS
jgi:hypothetical protein